MGLRILSGIFVFPTVILFFAVRIGKCPPALYSPAGQLRKYHLPVADVKRFYPIGDAPVRVLRRLKPPKTFLPYLSDGSSACQPDVRRLFPVKPGPAGRAGHRSPHG